MKRLTILFLGLMIAATGMMCKKGNKDCVMSASYSAPASETADIQAYLSSSGQSAVQHSSGLFYNITGSASGDHPSQCSRVSVRYTGRLTSGSVFDQSSTPVSFYLYELITGWRMGLPLIGAGQSIRLYIPPSLGYGNQQTGTIPPNSILIFDIDLVSVS